VSIKPFIGRSFFQLIALAQRCLFCFAKRLGNRSFIIRLTGSFAPQQIKTNWIVSCDTKVCSRVNATSVISALGMKGVAQKAHGGAALGLTL